METKDTRNYGDARILEFEKLAKDWETGASEQSDPERKRQHQHNAEFYHHKLKVFRQQHRNDPHWVGQAEIAV